MTVQLATTLTIPVAKIVDTVVQGTTASAL